MAARSYATLAAETAEDVDVTLEHVGPQPTFAVVVKAPLSSHLFLQAPAAEVVVLGLMRQMTAVNPAAAGELLDRLVQAWSER